ncbi:MAG: sulfatase-like hydrolase/transferase [Aureliella sp.]
MRPTVVCYLAVCLAALGTSLARAVAPEKPNVVFIMADDLGWGDVGFHGGNAPTPHLDKLASESLELAQHYVAPVCSPTRTGLLTGRCWSRFGVTKPINVRALPWDTVTLPRALQSVGYDTCLTGKWHLGSLPEQGPNHFGFDHSYGSLAGGVSPWNHRYKKGPFTRTWHRDEQLIEEQGHVTDLITREAVAWLESRGSDPFFLYVPFTAVHLPIKEPAEWLERVPDSIQGAVPRHYAACVMHLDNAVARILDALEKRGLRDNTLVVFTSDNGGSWAENNDLQYPDDNCPSGKLVGNNRPWRGQKGELYEGGVHVPALVRWPAAIEPGKVDSPVQIIDWMPTLCGLAGYHPKSDLKWDGMDISSLLKDRDPLPERPLYTVGPNWSASSLRVGDWKLIVRPAKGKGKAARELYRLSNDPAEANNLADQQPERLQTMLAELEKMAAADRDSEVK